MTLAIIGAGGWGTALSIVLAPKFERVRLWVHEQDLAARMNATRENDTFLKGFQLPKNVEVLTDLRGVVHRASVVIGAMPSHHARALYTRMLPHIDPSMTFVSATKGIENGTLLRMSEVIAEVTQAPRIAVLSGPTFAREVASGEPAAVVVAASDLTVATDVQTAFSGPSLRLYTNQDPIGVEVGAALKNVIAIGAGVCKGLGLGNNTLAALITRGLAEISRLAVAMGGEPRTLAGLAGLGDLVLTCSGDLSRNRQVGWELARGRSIEEITGAMTMVAEGVETCAAAVDLGAKFCVDLPIIQQMHAVLHRRKSPREALRDLMERTLKGE
ncbi:MAG TPA: NAD(P)H-dependent glycerol-3-phosphate dehydrogenase [Bryobacteraceae bacterium]|jgi:glycerol-3-phosphate dehydrogenase (NAD(P)+)|nr:NAD(P)H-dependent glycerol-3-phosphate dehydrogenase [Bryobacteraceae bacterium]